MKSWHAPDLGQLPGTGLVPEVHDTASGRRRRTVDDTTRTTGASGPPATARMYVCGITPYDATHLGHAATYVSFDLLNRAWRDAGCDVDYVQNVTDVDDPLLERAEATGEDWQAIAERETGVFRTEMAALRVVPPRAFVGAVEAIPLIVEVVQQLQAAGAVYSVDGDLYFSVATDDAFGTLSDLTSQEMVELFRERGGDPDRPGKKDPRDCLLWRAERPGEPAWPSPFGPGRPGWHVECTAIALHHLGMGFDLQGGGSDLVFPHHEMCAAEARVATGGSPFARSYAYQGMVGLGGEKMSKSQGNLVFSSRLRQDGVDPMAIRLALLAHHYREDWDWTDQELTTATRRLDRWRQAGALPAGPDAVSLLAGVRAALADDLDAPRALDLLDGWADAALAGSDAEATAPGLAGNLADTLLGIRL